LPSIQITTLKDWKSNKIPSFQITTFKDTKLNKFPSFQITTLMYWPPTRAPMMNVNRLNIGTTIKPWTINNKDAAVLKFERKIILKNPLVTNKPNNVLNTTVNKISNPRLNANQSIFFNISNLHKQNITTQNKNISTRFLNVTLVTNATNITKNNSDIQVSLLF
jgi:hypothetical protein